MWIRNHQPLDISAPSPIIAAILSALSSPRPWAEGRWFACGRRVLHMGHIIVTLLNNITESEERRLQRGSVLRAELDSAGTYSGEGSLPSSCLVGFGVTTAQANHAAQADSPQIKPGGGSALFLELIKWRTCCSSQFWTARNSVWTLAEHKKGEEFGNYAGCRPSLGYIESAHHCMNAGTDSHLISLQYFFPNHGGRVYWGFGRVQHHPRICMTGSTGSSKGQRCINHAHKLTQCFSK